MSDYVPIYDPLNHTNIVGVRPMTNKEWLATLSAEDFYKEFKKAEEVGKSYNTTSGYVIQWLDEERKPDKEFRGNCNMYFYGICKDGDCKRCPFDERRMIWE